MEESEWCSQTKLTLPTIKHGCCSILLWGCSASVPGELVRIQGIMDTENYLFILNINGAHKCCLWADNRRYNMKCCEIHGKNCYKIPRWPKYHGIVVLRLTTFRLKIMGILEEKISIKCPLEDRKAVPKEEWSKIINMTCIHLVNVSQKGLKKIIKNKRCTYD